MREEIFFFLQTRGEEGDERGGEKPPKLYYKSLAESLSGKAAYSLEGKT